MRIASLVAVACLLSGAVGGCARRAPESPQCPQPMAATPEPPAPAPAESQSVVIVRGLLGTEARATYDAFGASFREKVPLSMITESLAKDERDGGAVRELRLAEEEASEGRTTSTVLVFRERRVAVMRLTLDPAGVLVGLRSRDLVEREEDKGPGPADDYIAKRAYRLPGKGRWYIAHGGLLAQENNHVGNKQQWYAFDLDTRDDQGKHAQGDGARNEDHFVFGQPVLAPQAGKVSFVIDAVEDYPPGQREGYLVTGNTVIIDHGDDEFSVLAHFKKGSIVVKVGQTVKVGEKLGLTGNSGNSSRPHVHWHLATNGGLSRGHGLPIRLAPLLVNGKRVESPRPVRGDIIENIAD